MSPPAKRGEGSLDLPPVTWNGSLVVPIGLAELLLQIALLAQNDAVMEDQKHRDHQEQDPIGAKHERKAKQRDCGALVDRVSHVSVEAGDNDRRGRLVRSDVRFRLMKGVVTLTW